MIESIIEDYLKKQDPKWGFFFGGTWMSRDEVLKKFRKDKQFRKTVVQQVLKLATELFTSER